MTNLGKHEAWVESIHENPVIPAPAEPTLPEPILPVAEEIDTARILPLTTPVEEPARA